MMQIHTPQKSKTILLCKLLDIGYIIFKCTFMGFNEVKRLIKVRTKSCDIPLLV